VQEDGDGVVVVLPKLGRDERQQPIFLQRCHYTQRFEAAPKNDALLVGSTDVAVILPEILEP
jgi:hypothetical protein